MAGLTNQRTVSARRKPSVTFWAWTVSIAVHLIALTALGVVKFSQSNTQPGNVPIPTAKVSRIRELMQANSIIPKPKIKKPSLVTSRSQFARKADWEPSVNQIFDTAAPSLQNSANITKFPEQQRVFSLANNVVLPERIEFFGSRTDQRKVCYVVDCSGSMQGMFGRVRKELAESIQRLQPDQYFYIIFFGDYRLLESGTGQLLRATPENKSNAYDFINSVQPAGRTNALAALERAIQIRDDFGVNPSVIYFLTDGFELTTDDELTFPQTIANLQRRFAPMTKINTIGFWPQPGDRRILEAIARQTGGEFVLVADSGI